MAGWTGLEAFGAQQVLNQAPGRAVVAASAGSLQIGLAARGGAQDAVAQLDGADGAGALDRLDDIAP
jgi:hypothetical protein